MIALVVAFGVSLAPDQIGAILAVTPPAADAPPPGAGPGSPEEGPGQLADADGPTEKPVS